MSAYLFAYGTLRPDCAPAEIAAAVARLRPVGHGFLRGWLYDLGDYPGAIPDPASPHRIAGAIFRVPEEPDLLCQLDEYEGFDPQSPGTSLFVRVLQAVELAGGSTLNCWVYVFNRDPGDAPILV